MFRAIFGLWFLVTYWGYVLSLVREQDFLLMKIVIVVIAIPIYMAITRFLNIFDRGGEFDQWRSRY